MFEDDMELPTGSFKNHATSVHHGFWLYMLVIFKGGSAAKAAKGVPQIPNTGVRQLKKGHAVVSQAVNPVNSIYKQRLLLSSTHVIMSGNPNIFPRSVLAS